MIVGFPKNARDIINAIRNEIGRKVVFTYRGSPPIACPNPDCKLDPTTNLSTNSFCSICDGKYWIYPILTSGLIAHITHRGEYDDKITPFGVDFIGDVRVQIEYTSGNLQMVQNTILMDVDNISYEIGKFDLRGVPEINRIVIIGRQV